MSSNRIRLTDAVEAYLGHRAARFAAKTVQQETYVLRRFAAAVGDFYTVNVTATHVSTWFYGEGGLMAPHRTRDGQLRPAVQASTHNYYVRRLRSFFAFCAQRGWLRGDPLAEVTFLKETRKYRLQPPAHELLDMLDLAASPRDRAYLAVLTNTGLRAGSVRSLRVGDVDLSRQHLRVVIHKSKEEDAFPITSELDHELRRWLLEYAVEIGRPLRSSDYLFPSLRSVLAGPGWPPPVVRVTKLLPDKPLIHSERIVQAALARLGHPTKGEGSHTIRRAVARALFDDLAQRTNYDAALRTVSAFLHHKNVTTTEHYLGVTSEKRRRDERLKGRPFLSALVTEAEIIPFKASGDASGD